jgi:hypothetical protein
MSSPAMNSYQERTTRAIMSRISVIRRGIGRPIAELERNQARDDREPDDALAAAVSELLGLVGLLALDRAFEAVGVAPHDLNASIERDPEDAGSIEFGLKLRSICRGEFSEP